MKILCACLGLTILTVVVSSTLIFENSDLCEIERLYIIRQHDVCLPDGYRLENIFEQMQKIPTNDLSRYDMQQYLKEFCAKTDNATACYNVMSVTDRCKNSEVVINEINTLKFVETALKFMCEDEGSRFMDILNDDGAVCYALNDKHTECMNNQMESLSLDAEMMTRLFVERNTCRFIQAAKHCLYTYDDCVNKEVKHHMAELNKVLSNEYQC